MKQRCYIGICPAKQKQGIKRRLAVMPSVLRVTDHGGHLKVVVRDGLLRVPGLLAMEVKDETTHFDVRYWDHAMAAFRLGVQQGHKPKQTLNVTVHYLCNLLGIQDEAMYFARYAVKRARLDAAVSDKQAHGWELPHVKELRRRQRAKR